VSTGIAQDACGGSATRGRRRNGGISRTFRAGLAHHQAGRLDHAEALYRKVLARVSDHADALHLLGLLTYQRGEIGVALQLMERALPVLAELPDAHLNYGNALLKAGRPAEAIASYRRAIALNPDHGMAHNNLARVLIDQGEFEAGLQAARRSVELIPEFLGARTNYAGALFGLERFAEAEAELRRVLEFRPDLAGLHLDLGCALEAQKRLDEAATAYRRAIELRPDFAQAHNNLGNALKGLGQLHQAVACYEMALRLAAENAVIHNNLGSALREQGRLGAAVSSYRRALALRPDFATAQHNLGGVLAEQGQLAEAVVLLGRAARELDGARLDWFHVRRRTCDWADYDEHAALTRKAIQARPLLRGPWTLLTLQSTPEEQLACARRLAAQMTVGEPTLPARAQRPRDGRIRLGYLSADFRPHPVAILITGVIERHNRASFEVIGYSCGPDDDSEIRSRLVHALDRFVDIRGTSDRQAAELIRADAVDILIDLTGYVAHGRTAILAHRPAPVQVNYLGYSGTTGAEFVDYILVDEFLVPSDQQPFFAERLVHLPDCYQCTDDTRAISDLAPSRAECRLPEDGFVFCCFNNAYKITPDFFDVWMRLLDAVPGSVLWLRDDNRWARANLAREASARGVAPERIIFAPSIVAADHLARHRLADLFLDTLPYNAHATASDALWAGLPVLTCAGHTFASRVAGSLLRAVGLPELVTNTLQEYEALALRLARDGDMLAALRARLARNKWTHPLFDTERFARNIEAVYQQMWDKWRAGCSPAECSISPPADVGSD